MFKAFLEGLVKKLGENVAALLWAGALVIGPVLTWLAAPAVTLRLNRWQIAACVLALLAALAVTAWLTRHAGLRKRFYATQYGARQIWGSAEQRDGTIATQFNIDLMVKNLSARRLHLIKARVVRPKLGEPLTTMIFAGSGATAVLEPQRAGVLTLFMVVHGAPTKPSDRLAAVIAIADDEGREQRVHVRLRRVVAPAPPPKPATEA